MHWIPAKLPPKATLGEWSRDVVVVTNHGNVFNLAFFGDENNGVWQRPEQFIDGEQVEWWTDQPYSNSATDVQDLL